LFVILLFDNITKRPEISEIFARNIQNISFLSHLESFVPMPVLDIIKVEPKVEVKTESESESEYEDDDYRDDVKEDQENEDMDDESCDTKEDVKIIDHFTASGRSMKNDTLEQRDSRVANMSACYVKIEQLDDDEESGPVTDGLFGGNKIKAEPLLSNHSGISSKSSVEHPSPSGSGVSSYTIRSAGRLAFVFKSSPLRVTSPERSEDRRSRCSLSGGSTSSGDCPKVLKVKLKRVDGGAAVSPDAKRRRHNKPGEPIHVETSSWDVRRSPVVDSRRKSRGTTSPGRPTLSTRVSDDGDVKLECHASMSEDDAAVAMLLGTEKAFVDTPTADEFVFRKNFSDRSYHSRNNSHDSFSASSRRYSTDIFKRSRTSSHGDDVSDEFDGTNLDTVTGSDPVLSDSGDNDTNAEVFGLCSVEERQHECVGNNYKQYASSFERDELPGGLAAVSPKSEGFGEYGSDTSNAKADRSFNESSESRQLSTNSARNSFLTQQVPSFIDEMGYEELDSSSLSAQQDIAEMENLDAAINSILM